MENGFKTAALMAAIVALFVIIGGLLGGKGGMMIALLIAGGMNFFAYWYSDEAVLKMYNAQEVDAYSAPQLYGMVSELAGRAGLPMPRVYLIHEEQPNAFATGRDPDHAAVAATTGILKLLSARELRGVMAHELAHVRNRDTLISTISATVAGAISSITSFGLFLGGNSQERPNPILAILLSITAPIAASLIQMAISRAREFDADAAGAEISGDPLALAHALDKIERYAAGLPLYPAQQHPETAQMMIINPLSGQDLGNLFSTHPETAERIARLQALSQGYR